MRFESKKDAWLVLLGVLPSACAVPFLLLLVSLSTAWFLRIPLLGLLLVLCVLVPWVLFGTYYVVEAGILIVRAGPFRWRIRVSDIRRVRPTRSPISSPALSLDRLRIEYGDSRYILLSPQDREAFMNALGISAG